MRLVKVKWAGKFFEIPNPEELVAIDGKKAVKVKIDDCFMRYAKKCRKRQRRLLYEIL